MYLVRVWQSYLLVATTTELAGSEYEWYSRSSSSVCPWLGMSVGRIHTKDQPPQRYLFGSFRASSLSLSLSLPFQPRIEWTSLDHYYYQTNNTHKTTTPFFFHISTLRRSSRIQIPEDKQPPLPPSVEFVFSHYESLVALRRQ